MKQAMDSTAKLSAFVIFILIGARVFSLTFYGVDGHKWVEELLVGLPGGEVGFLIVVNILVFLLAFFLDFFELAFIIVPLLGPAAERLGIDLIWFGDHPGREHADLVHAPALRLRPVLPALGGAKNPYLDKLTGKRMEPVTTGQIYRGAIPFVVIQVIMIGLVIAFPGMVMHYKGAGTGVDPASIQQLDMPQMEDMPPLDFGAPGGALPGLEPPAATPGRRCPAWSRPPALPGLEPPPDQPPPLPGLEPPAGQPPPAN